MGGAAVGMALPFDMATTAIKTTYSLDVETVEALDRMAREWNVSKSEALRRAIRSAAEGAGEADVEAKLGAWRKLQESVALTPAKANTRIREITDERRASSSKREPKPRR